MSQVVILRPDWDSVWMEMAHVVAKRSLCSRAQIGCILVTDDNRVECATYNGPAPAFPHGGQSCVHWCPRSRSDGDVLSATYDDCPAGHAEANAIARADWTRLDGGRIYTTGSMCMGCAKTVTQTRIKHVYHVVDPTMAHRSPEIVEAYLRDMGVIVHRMVPPG